MSASRSAEPQATQRTDPHRGDHGLPHPAAVRGAWAAAVLFCLVATFHAALVLGAPWGEATQGGATAGTLPASGRLVAALSCVLSIAMAGAILARVGRGPLRRCAPRLRSVLAWTTLAYAAIAVVLNLITRSSTERALWAPVSVALLGLVSFVVVTSSPRRHPAASEQPPAPK